MHSLSVLWQCCQRGDWGWHLRGAQRQDPAACTLSLLASAESTMLHVPSSVRWSHMINGDPLHHSGALAICIGSRLLLVPVGLSTVPGAGGTTAVSVSMPGGWCGRFSDRFATAHSLPHDPLSRLLCALQAQKHGQMLPATSPPQQLRGDHEEAAEPTLEAAMAAAQQAVAGLAPGASPRSCMAPGQAAAALHSHMASMHGNAAGERPGCAVGGRLPRQGLRGPPARMPARSGA